MLLIDVIKVVKVDALEAQQDMDALSGTRRLRTAPGRRRRTSLLWIYMRVNIRFNIRVNIRVNFEFVGKKKPENKKKNKKKRPNGVRFLNLQVEKPLS